MQPLRRWLTSFSCALALAASTATPQYAYAAEEVMRIGALSPGSESTGGYAEAAFRKRLRELGWVEGRNVVVVMRYADGNLERLPTLIREIVEHQVDVIVTAGTQSAVAARQATASIPIVALMGDPVGSGLADTLARPGGNLTGVSAQNSEELPTKWVELIHETVPHLGTLAVIVNPENRSTKRVLDQVTSAAAALRVKLLVLKANTPEGYESALAQAAAGAEAVIVAQDPVAVYSRRIIAKQAAEHKLPSLYGLRQFTEAGGLISYGADESVVFRRLAEYVDKILRGAKPADLPIQQPTEFQLVINLRTARALGLRIPDTVLLRADELIR